MTIFHIYLIVGIFLLIGELMSGTFYLLVIGLSSAVASVFTLYYTPIFSLLIWAFLSLSGCFFIHKYTKKNHKKNNMVVNHIGQIAEVIEVSKNNLKVLYSGSYWDAVLQSRDTIRIGDTVRIVAFSNNILTIEKV